MGKFFDFSDAMVRCHAIYYVVCEGKTKTPKQCYEYYQALLAEEIGKYEAMGERKQAMSNGIKKAAKIAGIEYEMKKLEATKHLDPISAGAKSYLKRLYGELKFGKSGTFKDKGNKYSNKGLLAEADSIKLIAEMDNYPYEKNEIRKDNGLISGVPDAFRGESIHDAEYILDVKTSWDWETFSDNLGSELNPLYWWQLQGYLWLTGAKEGEVSYCLVNMPDSMINDELRYLEDRMRKRLNVIDLDIVPEYKESVEMLLNNVTFDNMEADERRLKFKVERDEAAIKKIEETIPKCREYLHEIQEMHLVGSFSDKEMMEFIEETE